MKNVIYFFILFITIEAWSLPKDFRAEIIEYPMFSELSISPNENLWLFSSPRMFITKSIDSNWQIKNIINNNYSKHADLYRINFFNKDTAILTGFIIPSNTSYEHAIYLTKNAGNSWEIINLKEGGDVTDVCIDSSGYMWMGGFEAGLYFSSNYGNNWQILNPNYDSSSRILFVFMNDTLQGICASRNNKLYNTNDNWKSCHNIETPFDQNKRFNINSIGNRIEKIALWKNYLIIKQSSRVFYTDTSKIEWRLFPVVAINFALDKNTGTLYTITDSLKVLRMITPNHYNIISDKQLSNKPYDIKAINNSLYVLTLNQYIYKINDTEFKRIKPYTIDRKISQPKVVRPGTNISWGASGDQLYLADSRNNDWYRENSLDFSVSDILLKNDSLAILWDGEKNNYIYSLSDHTPKVYEVQNPLSCFLTSPLEKIRIFSNCIGDGAVKYGLDYNRTKDSIFSATSYCVIHYQDTVNHVYNNNINASLFDKVLKFINSQPHFMPAYKDYKITDEDKKQYYKLIDNLFLDRDFLTKEIRPGKSFYYSIPAILDTINDNVFQKSIIEHLCVNCSSSSFEFSIQFINRNNDTLVVFCERNFPTPWNLPWEVVYNGLHFKSYDIEFSKLILQCLPDNFLGKSDFNSDYMIMNAASYLWHYKNGE